MSKKSVQFNLNDTVYTTYSSEEYDRSIYSSSILPITYTFRPSNPIAQTPSINTTPINKTLIKPLDLSVIPNARRRTLSSPIETLSKNTKKPKLSINTQSLTPLFFSGLSTHYKCKPEDDEEEEYGYLIPAVAC